LIAAELDDVIGDIRKSAENSRIDKEVLDSDDNYKHLIRDANVLGKGMVH